MPQIAVAEIGYKKPPPQQRGVAAQIAEMTGLSKDTVQRALADKKPEPKPVSPPSNFPQDDHERSIKWRRAFERVWNDAPSAEDREWAQDWIDRPIMDLVGFIVDDCAPSLGLVCLPRTKEAMLRGVTTR